MIAAGTYRAHATKAEMGFTKKGDPQVAVTFRLLDEEVADQELTWYGYFTEKTKTRTLESLVHAGWDGEDPDELAGLGTTEVSLVVAHEEYNGRVSARVQWVNAIGGAVLQKPMTESDKKAFAKSLRGDLAELRKRMKLDTPKAVSPRTRSTPFD